MEPYWSKNFGNPSATYKEGVFAKKALEGARREISDILKCRFSEIIFVNGATESINLAIRGVIQTWKIKYPKLHPEIITNLLEHEAVLSTCRALEKDGVLVHYISPSKDGIVNPQKIKKLLNKNTALVSIMYANNEIGTIQPIKEIGRIIKLFKLKTQNSKLKTNNYPLFHTDAVQATNYLNLDVNSLGVQLLTINSAKIYGPKGMAILYIKNRTPINSILSGGAQENDLRPGTENIPLIIGFALALTLAQQIKEKEGYRLEKLRDYFIRELVGIPGITLNGSQECRIPNNINISIDGIDNEFFVLQLDAMGISASTRSACTTDAERGSLVILALGKTEKEAKESIRLTLGRSTTKSDIDYSLSIIKTLLN